MHYSLNNNTVMSWRFACDFCVVVLRVKYALFLLKYYFCVWYWIEIWPGSVYVLHLSLTHEGRLVEISSDWTHWILTGFRGRCQGTKFPLLDISRLPVNVHGYQGLHSFWMSPVGVCTCHTLLDVKVSGRKDHE